MYCIFIARENAHSLVSENTHRNDVWETQWWRLSSLLKEQREHSFPEPAVLAGL